MSADTPPGSPPDAVRVWRGFRAPTIELGDFYERLNAVFVPATVLMQIDAGLDCYIPTVLAGLEGKPDGVPDETAILFWDSQQTYRDGFLTLAVRTYTLTHGAVYTSGSGAAFPLAFAGELQADQPYYLRAQAADWMHGTVLHLVGSRPANVDPATFHKQLGELLASQLDYLAGAIVCAGQDYLVYWELEGAVSSASEDRLTALARLVEWHHSARARPERLEVGLWDDWAGMGIAAGDSLNLQFRRRWEP